MASSEAFTKAELAERIGADVGIVDDLVDHGLIEPTEDGAFRRDDVHLARLMVALDKSGISLDILGRARDQEDISLEMYAEWFPEESSELGARYEDLVRTSDLDADQVEFLYEGLGLAKPDANTRIDSEEQTIVRTLCSFLNELGDTSLLRRALGVFAQAASQSAERGLALYGERLEEVLENPVTQTVKGMDPRLQPWVEFSRLGPQLLAWLYRRQLESAIDSFSVLNTERFLIELEYISSKRSAPEAVLFIDISGFTALSERDGDTRSALIGTGLRDLVDGIARRRGGKLVKLLGDGAMLHFPSVESAFEAGKEAIEGAEAAGLPPVHVGASCGPMVYRDGDYYGHIVNLAARLSAQAGSGTLLATKEFAKASGQRGFESTGELVLKGVSEPVAVFGWSR